jgi:hypothetical protein
MSNLGLDGIADVHEFRKHRKGTMGQERLTSHQLSLNRVLEAMEHLVRCTIEPVGEGLLDPINGRSIQRTFGGTRER